ncbi:MAG: hypothetical protein QOJ41_967 [Acidobacteriaceae bacterium]|jgi:hypothetical protein|nr:hypothetical protein [Acidobacteriaceae bacterium]
MLRLKLVVTVSFVLLIALSVSAQQFQSAPPVARSTTDKPVWALEFVRVKPGMFAATMGYLDDNWIRLRAEAKRQGAVLNYHRVAGEDSSDTDWDILLMTEYKNQAAYDGREKLFESILKQVPNITSEVIKGYKKEELFQSVKTRALQDFSENGYPQLRLLTMK